jgi:hypothetical protein
MKRLMRQVNWKAEILFDNYIQIYPSKQVRCGFDSFGSGYRRMANSSIHRNEIPDSIKFEGILDWLNSCQLARMDSTPWN